MSVAGVKCVVVNCGSTTVELDIGSGVHGSGCAILLLIPGVLIDKEVVAVGDGLHVVDGLAVCLVEVGNSSELGINRRCKTKIIGSVESGGECINILLLAVARSFLGVEGGILILSNDIDESIVDHLLNRCIVNGAHGPGYLLEGLTVLAIVCPYLGRSILITARVAIGTHSPVVCLDVGRTGARIEVEGSGIGGILC